MNGFMVKFVLIFLLTLVATRLDHNKLPVIENYSFTMSPEEKVIVDSLFSTMTIEEKVGQLFMIRAHSDKGPAYEKQVEEQIKKYNVGGLCFFQGTAGKQVELINRYQRESKIPLMVSMDAEWGPAMRFKTGVVNFPRQLMMGALQDNTLIYDFGKEIARQLKSIGVHVNFAPVIDINNNPSNPVINDRSFGEDRSNVISKGQLYASGLQDGGVMAVGKHFPGHGDTDTDSHYDLPVLKFDSLRLSLLEMFPFKILGNNGLQGVMIAHLNVPALDNTPKLPTSLSRKVIHDLLKIQYNFQGLIFTDAMEMQGVLKNFKAGEAEVMTLQAGSDVVLLPSDMKIAFESVLDAVVRGRINRFEFNQKVQKILLFKLRLGVLDFKELDAEKAEKTLTSEGAKKLKKEIIKNAITLIRDEDGILPVRRKAEMSFASVAIGKTIKTLMQSELDNYGSFDHFSRPSQLTNEQITGLVKACEGKDLVIVSIYNMNKNVASRWGVHSSVNKMIAELENGGTRVCVVMNGSPYAAAVFDDARCLVTTYIEDEDVEKIVPAAIFGAYAFKGKLPVTSSNRAKFGQGVETELLMKLSFSTPEELNIDEYYLRRIDSISNKVVTDKAAPGCVVLIAKDGKIFYHKAFGYHTESKARPMRKDDIFDVASITKVAATTLAVMKLYDMGKLDISLPISHYLKELEGTNKSKMTVEEIMTHKSGLISWIPFYRKTLTVERRKSYASNVYYMRQEENDFRIRVAENLFMRNNYVDEIWNQIIESPVSIRKTYIYSDLGMYLLARMVERVSGRNLAEFVREEFYNPMGLEQIGYLPLEFFSKEKIVPSEKDNYFRNQILQGYVHDMGAAMLGGVAGHAGIFSDALSLAAIMEMLRNRGFYNGERLLSQETVDLFTHRMEGDTRRGLGFDMKQVDRKKAQNLTELASDQVFGHTGFTGTCAWTDPENGFVYIFLSNRTYPTMDNRKLITGNYRNNILDNIYYSLRPGHNDTALLITP